MRAWDLGALARAAEARVSGGALPVSVKAVGTDSRSLPPACLFVALRGDRFDGHQFLKAAVQGGAVAVVVDEAGAKAAGDVGVPMLVVKDTLAALGAIARAIRLSEPGPVVAVTGSNGKTTTKELIAAALSPRGAVHKTQGNLNNLIGVPLTLVARPEGTWAQVIEMGMNVRHEIDKLALIAVPDVGVITTVGPAHLEGLGTVENVARAKAELFEMLPESATAIINADDPLIMSVAVPFVGKRKKLTFGRAAGCDVRIVKSQPTHGASTVTLSIAGKEVDVTLPLAGSHNVANAAAAAACAHALGLEAAEIAKGLASVQVPGGRQRILRDLPSGVSVIDDTYNANPQSMIASFSTLAELAPKGARRIAVVGDMFEMGETAPVLHRQVGEAAAKSGIAWVLALGPHATETAKGARDSGAQAEAFADIEALNRKLAEGMRPGDWITVKGSRGMKMERVVDHLTGQSPGDSH